MTDGRFPIGSESPRKKKITTRVQPECTPGARVRALSDRWFHEEPGIGPAAGVRLTAGRETAYSSSWYMPLA